MRKTFMVAVALFIGIALALLLARGTLNAQGAANSDSDVLSKLDDIVKSQQELMTAINSIKEDLQVIKLRITQMQ